MLFRVVTRFLLFWLGVSAAILIVELIFGHWFAPMRYRSTLIPRDVNLSINVSELYPGQDGLIHYRRDSYGLRGKYRQISEINLLTFGGSATDQRYIDDQRTWQSVMQDQLQASKVNLQIANIGVDGQSSVGHIALLEQWLASVPGLHPQYALFYIGLNDFARAAQPGNWDNLSLPDGDYLRVLQERSALFNLWRTWLGVQSAKQSGVNHRLIKFDQINWLAAGTLDQQALVKVLEVSLDNYRSRLARIIELCRSQKIVPIFVTQANYEGHFEDGNLIANPELSNFSNKLINGVDRYNMLKIFNLTTCQAAQLAEVQCWPLDREVDFTSADFYDFYHNTPSGTAKIGTYLARKFKELQNKS